MLGKLGWDAIPFHDPIPLITSAVVLLAGAVVAVIVWRKGWWPYLRDEYITPPTTSASASCTSCWRC